MTEIRSIEADELADYRRAMSRGFGYDGDPDPDYLAHFSVVNPLETSVAAFDRGRVVATFGSYHLDLTLPGGAVVAMAGTTHVTVSPTHRRRGILTEMMRRHLEQSIELGQPVAGLWASEERIYGRFGYGPATMGQVLVAPDHAFEVTTPDPAITLHELDVAEARSILPPAYESVRVGVAGALVRTEDWWNHRHFPDPPSRRGGEGAQRYVMAERGGEAVGYVRFRLKELDPWGEGQTSIVELVAPDDEVRLALWHFVANIDLHRNLRWWNAPIEEPLLFTVDRFRTIERRVMDALWLRPLAVTTLLDARSYEADGTLVFGLADRFGPTAGRYRLEVVDGVGRCQRLAVGSGPEPEVELAVEELGRLLLGGTSAVALGRAGLVAGEPAAVARLHDLFTTRDQPHCSEVF